MHRPSIAERRELGSERRDRDLGEGLRRPAALAVHHADRPHMPVKRQFAGALMKYLAVDLARLLGGEKDAERRDCVGPAAAQPLFAHRRRLRVLWRRDRAGHPGVGRWADHVYGDPLEAFSIATIRASATIPSFAAP